MTKRTRYSDPVEGLMARLEPEDGCLVYTGSRDRLGYGKLRAYGKPMLAHRFAWELANGPIENGLHLDHTCHNPSCCKIEHLRLATQKLNMENQIRAHKGSSSGVRGVYWNAQRNMWQTQVRHNGKAIYCGLYASIEEAERTVIRKRNELFQYNDADRKVA